MKTRSNLILVSILLALFVSISSCSKDDEETRDNQVEYNGVIYELSGGLIYIGDLDEGERYSSIVLYSSGIHFDSNDGFSGTGNAFWFEDIVHTSVDIQGTYEAYDWLNTNQTGGPGFIEEVEFNVNRKYPTNTMEDEGDMYEFYEGEAKINKSGSTYTVRFDGKDESGKDVSLYYKGSLIEIQ